MAADVSISPKRTIVDFFKTSDFQEGPIGGKKAKGILGFCTSTPRSAHSIGSAASSCEKSIQASTANSSRVIPSDYLQGANDSEDHTEAKSTPCQEQPAIHKSSKDRSKPKNRKSANLHSVKNSTQTSLSSEAAEAHKDDKECIVDDVAEKMTSKPQEIDYEEFKRLALLNQKEKMITANKSEDCEVTKRCLAEEVKSASSCEENADNNKQGTTTPEEHGEKRSLRPRTKKSYQEMMALSSPVLSHQATPSLHQQERDDSDLSLHGKDILEMTYEEYLKSIGASFETSENNAITVSETLTQPEADDHASSVNMKKASSSSLLSYFSKTPKIMSSQKPEEETRQSMVTVVADIHGEPSSLKSVRKELSKSSAVRQSAAKSKQKCTSGSEIILLGSETIDVENFNYGDSKQSVSTKEQAVGVMESETSDKNSFEYSSQDNSGGRKNEVLMKKAQATLEFNKDGGLKMIRAERISLGTDADSCETAKLIDKNRKKSFRHDKDSTCFPDTSNEEKGPCENEQGQGNAFSRLRNCSGLESDIKEFTPRSRRASTMAQARAQELLQRARQQSKQVKHTQNTKLTKQKGGTSTTGDKKKLSEQINVTDGLERRQSVRLQTQKTQEHNLHCKVISDSDEEVKDWSPRRCSRKPSALKSSSKKPACLESPKKAAVTKLAPIFSKKKECGSKSERVQHEDAEVQRRRREFLMSGVPSELRSQTLASSTASAMASDYAPWPELSHVQQKTSAALEDCQLDVWHLVHQKDKLQLQAEYFDLNEKDIDFTWSKLQWPSTPMPKQEKFSMKTPANWNLSNAEQEEALVQELQQTYPNTAITSMFDRFKTLFAGDGSKPTCTEDSKTEAIGSDSATNNISDDSDVLLMEMGSGVEDGQSDKDSYSQHWTEILQPAQAVHLIGNKSSIQRLCEWLEEWKKLIQSEAYRAAHDGSSDGNSSDGDDEARQLCNTVLIVGPQGVGKTAAVYALAQQLSYKVFEVNASSSRLGKHILAQVQEATQSHQVAQKRNRTTQAPSSSSTASSFQVTALTIAKETKLSRSEKEKTSPGKSFAVFSTNEAACSVTQSRSIKTSASRTPQKRKRDCAGSPKTTPKKLRGESGRDKAPKQALDVQAELQEVNLAGRLNLSNTSLILFDEVDIVFKEDSGFLQTVQHFIHTTKIPIIMTTSDADFCRQITARFEQLTFKPPSLMCMTSYLQSACLAAGIRTCAKDIQALASACAGDVRHALLTLQFLVLSGGGTSTRAQSVCIKPKFKDEKDCTKETTSLKQAVSAPASLKDSQDSNDDDFVCLRRVRKTVRRVLLDDEEGDCTAGVPATTLHTSCDSIGASAAALEIAGASTLPAVHLSLCESMLGLPSDVQLLFADRMKNAYSEEAVSGLARHHLELKAQHIDFLQFSLFSVLPLPTTKLHSHWTPQLVPAKQPLRKRIRLDSLVDSEGSDGEYSSCNTIPVSSCHADDDPLPTAVTRCSGEEQTKADRHGNSLCSRVLRSFAQYYDAVSMADTMHCSQRQQTNLAAGERWALLPGMDDSVSSVQAGEKIEAGLLMQAEIEVRSARRLLQSVKQDVAEWEKTSDSDNLPEHCYLPLSGNLGFHKTIVQYKDEHFCVPEPYKTAFHSVVSNLPLTSFHCLSSISLDYLPMLRTISQAEHCRQIAKAKRRFHHYFDNIGLCLCTSTVNVLNQGFPSDCSLTA